MAFVMFELSISKQQLVGPLLMVANAVDKKQSVSILSNILLKLVDQQLILIATDLEIEITASVACTATKDVGRITVPAKKLIDIIRNLDDDALPTILFNDQVVIIKEGRSQFKLATLSADDYPSSDENVNDIQFTVSRVELLHLFQSVHFAMAQQDVRVFLNSMLLEIDSLGITAVATDGHRMAISKLASPIPFSHHRLLVPRKCVLEMLRLLSHGSDETVSISAGANHIQLLTSQFSLLSKLTDARFPPYIKAIPRDQDKSVIISRDLMKRALSRMIILANEKSHAVVLHLQQGQLTFIANNQEHEEASEVIEAQTKGSDLKIAVNANYLLDVLSHINATELRLSFSDTNSSILVESAQDVSYQYIIMPVKL